METTTARHDSNIQEIFILPTGIFNTCKKLEAKGLNKEMNFFLFL